MEQVMGVEPTSSEWKSEIIAVIRHLHLAVLCLHRCYLFVTIPLNPVSESFLFTLMSKATTLFLVFKLACPVLFPSTEPTVITDFI